MKLRGAPFGGIIVRFILVENRTVHIHMLVLSYSNKEALQFEVLIEIEYETDI